jgi:dolichol-phosphate mannosyltransferase
MINKIRRLGLDLIIVDEHSTDGTQEIARGNNIAIYQRDGSGKGWGVRKAFEVAGDKKYEIIALIDCDCSYPAEAIPTLIKFFPDYDMVVGVRDMHDIQFSHRIVNIFHTLVTNLLFGLDLSDINSGLRALKVEKFHGLLDAQGFDIEAQITAIALKNKFKIKEVPVQYKKRVGRSKIRWWDTFRIFKRLIYERCRK